MDWKKQAMQDLRTHESRKQSIENTKSRIAAINLNKQSIKAVVTEATPVQGGMSKNEERILNLICEEQRLRLTYAATKRLVDIVENALCRLDETERKVLDRFYINHVRGHVECLMEELNFERSRVYQIKDEAIYKFTITLYGITDY